MVPGVFKLIDPSESVRYTFLEQEGSPRIASLLLPTIDGLSFYRMRYQIGTTWSDFFELTASQEFEFGPNGVNGLDFSGYDANDQLILLPDGYLIQLSFVSEGNLVAALFAQGQAVSEPTTVCILLLGLALLPVPMRRLRRFRKLPSHSFES